MDFRTYNENAVRTESRDFLSIINRLADHTNIRLLHGTVGLATEISELLQALEDKQPGEIDVVNVQEEIGDMRWYLGVLFDARGITEQHLRPYTGLPTVQGIVSRLSFHTGMLQDLLKKHLYYGKVFNTETFDGHLTDVYSLLSELAYRVMSRLEDIEERNIAKLKARYGDKFTEAAAIHRDLDAERAILGA